MLTRNLTRGALVAAVLLVASACGGSDDSTGLDTQAPTTAPADQSPADDQADGADTSDGSGESDGGTGPGGLAPGTARVTIGGTTWEAVADIQCLDFGVALGFQGHAVDDPGIEIFLDANTDDLSFNSASMDIDDTTHWRAGDTFVGIGATRPVVTAENGYGTGTATFTNVNSLVERETAEGSYEFFCG